MALIRTWKPWEQSTGPRTDEGKRVSSRNAWTGGHLVRLRELVRETNEMLREQQEWRSSQVKGLGHRR